MRNKPIEASSEVDVAGGRSGGFVLAFRQGLFELPLEQLRLDLLRFRAVAEVRLPLRRLIPKQRARALEVRRLGPFGRSLVRNHPAEGRVDFQPRAAARTNGLHLCSIAPAHESLVASSFWSL